MQTSLKLWTAGVEKASSLWVNKTTGTVGAQTVAGDIQPPKKRKAAHPGSAVKRPVTGGC
ncbi:hypothetical protein [Neisseria wadsworthii]|uniref:hypothetical protein n=1 Tax=Neisseria wadsworthii TaxID=607711 RepID=UPI0003034DD2|nr:hypothetical protein [Neisseria wadsworthii]QMT34785.1 hypothetical protein H3L96_06755 [Neisseria wadsworthii]